VSLRQTLRPLAQALLILDFLIHSLPAYILRDKAGVWKAASQMFSWIYVLFQFTKATEHTPQCNYRMEYIPLPDHRPDYISRWYTKRKMEVKWHLLAGGSVSETLGTSGRVISYQTFFRWGQACQHSSIGHSRALCHHTLRIPSENPECFVLPACCLPILSAWHLFKLRWVKGRSKVWFVRIRILV